MSLRRRVFISKVFHDNNLAKFNIAEVDTCKLCGSARDGQQHILRECSDPVMMRRRRRQETSLHRKVCTAEISGDLMAIFCRGYYNMAVERPPNAHELWIAETGGVYLEPALLDLEGMELVIVDIPTDRQFNALRFCGESRRCS